MNIEEVINKLNMFNEIDPKAAYELFSINVEVNESFAHKDCRFICGIKDDKYIMGVLGVINGLIDDGVICMNIDKQGKSIFYFEKY